MAYRLCGHQLCTTVCVFPHCRGCLMQGGLTAFFYAVQNSQIEAMRVLVNEFNCSPNARGGVSEIGSLITQNMIVTKSNRRDGYSPALQSVTGHKSILNSLAMLEVEVCGCGVVHVID